MRDQPQSADATPPTQPSIGETVEHDVLSDDLLDHVAGGGAPTCISTTLSTDRDSK